jgi:hypothetical protein
MMARSAAAVGSLIHHGAWHSTVAMQPAILQQSALRPVNTVETDTFF